MGYKIPAGLETPPETSRLIRRWRWRRVLAWFAGVLVVLIILSGTTTWVRDALMQPLVLPDQPVKSDVIIVLGAGTRKNTEPLPPQAKQRVLEGIQLWKQGFAKTVIMSGGQDKNTGLVESQEMAAYALDQQLLGSAVLMEEDSKDTFQNAEYSLAIMREHSWKTAIVVTSPYHTLRACRIFRKQGATVKCVQAPFALLPVHSVYERLTDTRSVIREYGAILYNWLKREI